MKISSVKQLPFNTKNVLGGFVVCLGVTLLFLKSWILEVIPASILLLQPNSLIEKQWVTPPEPLSANLYFFNWTNPEDFLNLKTKPRLKQLEPYKFFIKTDRRNVVWNDNNTLTFNQVRYWIFDEEHTKPNLSEKITTIHCFAMTLAYYVRHWNYFVKKAASFFLSANSYDFALTKTADEFLGAGFDEPLVSLGQYLPFLANDSPKYEKFGLLLIRNGSETFEGVYNMANGVNGNFDIKNWKYSNSIPQFNGSCTKVRGSLGDLNTRTETKDYFEFFFSDLCRSLKLDFEEEVVVDGITGYKYSLGKNALDNGTLVPGNECYCTGECVPSGMINNSACQFGSPFFISLPHFYKADPIYLDSVEGLQPDRSKHEAYIILEPRTKIILKCVLRIQINVFVQPVKYISLFENVPKIFFPSLWLEVNGHLPENLKFYLKLYLFAPHIIISLAVIFITLGIYVIVFLKYSRKIFMYLCKRPVTKRLSMELEPEEIPLREDVYKCEI